MNRHVTGLTYHQLRRAQQASGKISSFFPVSHVTQIKQARLPQLRLLLIAVGVRMLSGGSGAETDRHVLDSVLSSFGAWSMWQAGAGAARFFDCLNFSILVQAPGTRTSVSP